MVEYELGGTRLIDRIDWDNIMKMSRYAGGHDEQMEGLLKDVIVIAHWNEGEYQGNVATCVQLRDTDEIVIYNDCYGSCSGCDAWENADDLEVKRMCEQLAGGALVFKNLNDCIQFLKCPEEHNKDEKNGDWFGYTKIAVQLLPLIEEYIDKLI